VLQENYSLAVIITLRANPLPKALSERAKWPVLGGADALVGLLLEQTVKLVFHTPFTWMATRIEDGWAHLVHSPLPDFPNKVEKVP